MVTKINPKPTDTEAQPETGQTKTRTRAKTQAKPSQAKTSRTSKAKTPKAKAESSPKPPTEQRTDFSLSSTQTTLCNLLTIVEPAVSSKPSNPVLGYLKIEVRSGACSVTASDQHQAITASATCHTLCQGVGLLPTQLIDVVKATQVGDSLTLTGTTADDSEVSLSTPHGVISTTPLAMTAEQFPGTILSPDVPWHNVSAQKLRLGLQAVLSSAAPKEIGTLKSVHFVFDTANETVTCETTDGHRVAVAGIDTAMPGRAKRKSAQPEPEQVDCIVPLDVVKSLIKILNQAQEESEVSIRLDGSKALFQVTTEHSQVELVCQCLAEAYPNVQGLLSQFKYDKSAIVSQAAFLQRLHILAALSDEETGVKLLLKDSIVQASRNGKQLQGAQTIEATIGMETDEFTIHMNLPLLIDLVKVLKDSEVLIQFGSPQSLVKLTPTAASDLKGIDLACYLMPLEVAKAK